MKDLDKNLLDCYFKCLVTICEKYGLDDFHYLFVDYIAFDYKKTGKTVGENLKILWINEDVIHVNRDYDLIRCNFYTKEVYKENIKEYISKSIFNNENTIIFSDLYNCPWTKYYHIQHAEHYFMLSDEIESNYIINDPYFGVQNHAIDKNELLKLYVFLSMYRLRLNNNHFISIKNILFQNLSNVNLEKILAASDILIHDIAHMLIENEVVNNISFSSTLVRKLKNLCSYRFFYAKMLKAFSNESHIDLEEEIKILTNLGSLWNRLAMMIIKIYFSRNLNKKTEILVSLIKNITFEEINIIKRLLIKFE